MLGNCGYRPLPPFQGQGTNTAVPYAGQIITQVGPTGPVTNPPALLHPGAAIVQPGPTGPVVTSAAQFFPNLPPAPQAVLTESPDLGTPNQPPVALIDTRFTQGYLRTKIGSEVRVEFLIGEDTMQDRRGTLLDVAVDYIILLEADTDDHLLCDMYDIKFVTFYR